LQSHRERALQSESAGVRIEHPTRCFAEDYLAANPQVSTATYNGNFGRSNYHALQVGFTLRPTQGFSIQSTYSWAKAMQLPGSGYTDPLMREIDRVRSVDQLHNLRTNGTVELPIGPNKLFFGNSSGWVARLIERWQTSFILNMSNGSTQQHYRRRNHALRQRALRNDRGLEGTERAR
jgi:hypothetical protein